MWRTAWQHVSDRTFFQKRALKGAVSVADAPILCIPSIVVQRAITLRKARRRHPGASTDSAPGHQPSEEGIKGAVTFVDLASRKDEVDCHGKSVDRSHMCVYVRTLKLRAVGFRNSG